MRSGRGTRPWKCTKQKNEMPTKDKFIAKTSEDNDLYIICIRAYKIVHVYIVSLNPDQIETCSFQTRVNNEPQTLVIRMSQAFETLV